jgi:polar amino acid transport system substrate-binding protein
MKKTLLALVACTTLVVHAAPPEFKTAPDWLKLPEGRPSLGNQHGDVAVSSRGEVYVSVQDPQAGLQVYAPDGRFLRNVRDAPSDFHGFVIRTQPDGEFIFASRLREQSIVKMTLDGKAVMTIPGSAVPDEHKNRNARSGQLALALTGLDVAPNGDIYVTDGYASDYIHRFDRTGKRILSSLLLAAAFALPQQARPLAPTGTLRAAFLVTNPVQARTDPKTGAVNGPSADLARELGRRLGVPVTLMPEPNPAAVIERIKAHQADIGFLAYEAARAAQVEFSDPYALVACAYLVRADSDIKSSADIDRASVTIGAAKGQSQEIYVSEHMKQARISVLPETPAHDALVALLTGRKIDAFAANRQRMEEAARTSPQVRVLSDNFLMIGQAIVVEKGDAAHLDEVNRFIADVRGSGFVKSSLERAALAGVEVAPAPKR